jgi:hypothetical protein
MRNEQKREAKDRKHSGKDKIQNPSMEKEFIDPEGNRFTVTARGLFYCPKAGGAKKHPCPDCYFCQWCSDSRCGLCRRGPQSCTTGEGSSD